MLIAIHCTRGLSHKRWSSGKTGTLVFPEDHFDFYGTALVLPSLLATGSSRHLPSNHYHYLNHYHICFQCTAVRAELCLLHCSLSLSKCLGTQYRVAQVVCDKLLLTFAWQFRHVTKLGGGERQLGAISQKSLETLYLVAPFMLATAI